MPPVEVFETHYRKFWGTSAKKYEVTTHWKRRLTMPGQGLFIVEIQHPEEAREPFVSVSKLEEELLAIDPASGTKITKQVAGAGIVYIGDEINRLGTFTRGRNRLVLFRYPPPVKERLLR